MGSALRGLFRVHLIGKVEAAHIPEAAHFLELFNGVFERLQAADAELCDLSDAIASLQSHLPEFERAGNAVQDILGAFRYASAAAAAGGQAPAGAHNPPFRGGECAALRL